MRFNFRVTRKKVVLISPAVLISALLILAPAVAEITISDDVVREYRIVNLEPPAEDSVRMGSNLENVVGYTSRLHRVDFEDQQVYLLERDERSPDNDHYLWKLYMDARDMSVFRIERKVVSRSGKTVMDQWTDYRDPAYNHPRPLCHIFTITMFVMSKELKVGARYQMYMILGSDSAPWRMYINVTDEERVKVPAGEFDCFVIKLEPDYEYIMGRWSWTAPMVKQFVPEYTFWMMKEEPHAMVKFQGTMGPVGGSPPQAHELTSISAAPE